MSTLISNCLTTFRAFHTSGTRSISDIFWITLHDEEGSTAKGAAVFFTERTSTGSAHLCVDDKECYRCLGNEDIPWAAASAPQIAANTHGFHIEQAGFAKWSAVIWKSHLDTLKRAAFKAALHSHLFNLPVQFVTAADLVTYGRGGALKKGITTHAEISKASKVLDPAHADRYSHTDPGPFWPRILFMYLVRRYYGSIANT